MRLEEDAVSDVRRSLDELRLMEEAVARKGFDEGVQLGDAAQHEIRALICHPRGDDHVIIASGDKWGDVRVGLFARADGAPVNARAWHKLPPLPVTHEQRVVDALCSAPTRDHEWLAIGTRGNGAWLVSLEEALDESQPFKPLPLPGSEDRVVRRLLYDAHSRTLWGAVSNEADKTVETRLVAWRLERDGPYIVADIDTKARVTALAIDHSVNSPHNDHFYIATNLSLLHRIPRSPYGTFEVNPDTLEAKNAVWRGRSSVIESIIPLSRIERYDAQHGKWVRRFTDRGIVATTLRHVMVMSDLEDKGLLCDVRRVAVFSKILAAAPVCLPKWSGIAVATLDGKIRLFRPSGIRRPEGDFVPYCEDAPENLAPRSLIGGYEDIEMAERVYAITTLRPRIGRDDERARVILGMGDHTVRFTRFEVGWAVRERATRKAQEIVERTGAEELLRFLEGIALHSYSPSPDKYAVSVLLPELGVLCQTPDLWRRLKLLVWDVLAGTDSPALHKVPVHVVQSLRRLQMLYPEKQEEVEQTILGIRKHIFDKQSFSNKSHDFLSLTESSDPDLSDDRVVYQSILISRRHDPVFRKRFTGEVRSFAALRTSEPDETSPNAWRFLIGTYRGTLSIFDADGNGCEVGVMDGAGGHVQSILVTPRWIVFAFSKGTIRRVARREFDRPIAEPYELTFEVISEHENAARSLAPLPGADEQDERFLWGDTTGRIRLGPTGQEIAKVRDDLAYGDATINVLRSFVATIDGEKRRYFVAGTDLGEVYLYEWREGREDFARRRYSITVGSSAVTSMLVHDAGLTQIVVGCADGNVAGLWVTEDEQRRASLSIYWSYRAADAVHDIQLLPVNVGTGDRQDRLLGIASHDQHIHVLDHVGRHLETVFLDKVKLDQFAAIRDYNGGGVVECRIFACAFENDFFSFRLISRRKMLERLGNFVEGLNPDERERRLSRWRAFAIREDHLRRRFVRQSRRYPGPDAWSAIEEIHRVLQIGITDDGPTAVVTALLRRLFQNRIPGELKPTGRTMGLREILEDRDWKDLYIEVVKMLHELEEQWDTPGSDANRRVQYFWIRSLLRNIEDLPMLRKWLKRSNEAASKVRFGEPGELLYHFLEHPNEVVQFKVLQCVERLLFGWPGVPRPGVIASSEAVEPDDLEWLLRALLLRLRNDTSQHNANVVALQIGKMLCELIRTGCADALRLAYELLDREIPARTFTILAGQCSVMAIPGARAVVHDRTLDLDSAQQRTRNQKEDAQLRRAASLFRAVERLDDYLSKRRDTASIIEAVDGIVDYCDAIPASSPFPAETAHFYRAVKPLLGVRTLSDIVNLPADLLPDGDTANGSLSYARLAGFRDVIDRLHVYYEKKYNDISVTKLAALTFESFDDARSAWRTLRKQINLDGKSDRPPMLEYLLLKRIADVWEEVLGNEQNEELLRDLVEVVQSEALDTGTQHPNATAAIARLQQAEEFMARALENFLTRLVLFSEPARAALFHRSGETDVTAYVYDAARRAAPAIEKVTLESWPDWLDRLWWEPKTLSELTEESVRGFLATTGTGPWETIEIPDIGEGSARFGYFMFGWDDQEKAKRFKEAKLLWNLLLQSLVFRKASLQRDVMTSRVFAMVAHNLGSPVVQIRTHAELLLDDLLDTEMAKQEKYAQILRQGCHMQGIMDAILSIDGRESKPSISEISLASLVHEVVRTERTQIRKKVTIHFPQPSDKMIEDTKFFTDEIRVYDILLNLLGNAVKYSPKNGTVWVTVNVTSRNAEIRVRDEGPGIPDDEKQRVFEPFIRGRSAIRRKIGGLGLGLYVVRLYTTSLNGRVHIQDESPHGTSFIVYLPTLDQPAQHSQIQEASAHAHPLDR